MLLRKILCAWVCVVSSAASVPVCADLVQTLTKVKPAIVGVGTILPTRSPARIFSGTGFVVGDGLTVVTNAHVLPKDIDKVKKETLAIISGTILRQEIREARVIGLDVEHDIALLRISGAPLPSLILGDSARCAKELR